MSGKFSRCKGRREEQQLVLALAKLGYKAERILRQYLAPGEADVKAVKDNKEYTFEMKSRRNSFKALYDLYDSEQAGNKVLAIVEDSLGQALALSTNFEVLEKADYYFRNVTSVSFSDKKKQKAALRLFKLKELKQKADFLVIRDNNKPRLYIRYW